MAKIGRPIKENADYFSHDTNASEDIKVMALESRMGLDGYAIYFKVLELLTKSNKFQLDLSKKYISDGIPQLLKINCELFEKFLKNAVELELLILDENKILYSKGLKKRLQVLIKYRRYDRNRKKTFPDGKLPENSGKSSSKVKESKVKESKVKNINTDVIVGEIPPAEEQQPQPADEVSKLFLTFFSKLPNLGDRMITENLISEFGIDKVNSAFIKTRENLGVKINLGYVRGILFETGDKKNGNGNANTPGTQSSYNSRLNYQFNEQEYKQREKELAERFPGTGN